MIDLVLLETITTKIMSRERHDFCSHRCSEGSAVPQMALCLIVLYGRNTGNAGKGKVHLVKAMFFPVVMNGCESWTIKKVECRRIDAFEW